MEQNKQNAVWDEGPELRPVWPVILFVGCGECAELSPTPEVGGFSASYALWGHPCPDELNSSLPIATDHERLSSGKCDMSIPDVFDGSLAFLFISPLT